MTINLTKYRVLLQLDKNIWTRIWNSFINYFFNFKLIIQYRVLYLKLVVLQVYIWNPAFRLTEFHAGGTTVYGGIAYLIQRSWKFRMLCKNVTHYHFCKYRFQDFSKFKFDFLLPVVYSIWAPVLKIQGFCDVILCCFLSVFWRFEGRQCLYLEVFRSQKKSCVPHQHSIVFLL